MDSDLRAFVSAFANLHVVVIGEAMLDTYLEGFAERICREAPVPIVALSERKDLPGGAANTAVNLRGLGARVSFLSVVGDDREGDLLIHALQDRGVATDGLLVQPGRQTVAKHRVMASAQMLLRFDQGSTGPVSPSCERDLIDRLAALYTQADAVIVSDYGYGVLTKNVIRALERLQSEAPRVLTVDARDLTRYRNARVTAAKPNYDEAIELLGIRPAANGALRAGSMLSHGQRALDLVGCEIVAITLDREGAVIFERDHPPYRAYAHQVPESHVAGAGDTFTSAFTLALAVGAQTPAAADIASAAADLASAAAAVVVSKRETATCSASELQEYLSLGGKQVDDLSRLATRVDLYRQQGRRIVFTNGCFDILHRGHITYLSAAKALGDVLIVGVNTDGGVRRLKGQDRPVNPLEDRLQVLAALSCVDHLVAFDDDTPERLIGIIRPDIFVKGGDYTRDALPEAALVEKLGGTVQILPYVENRSTTSIIQRIRGPRAHADGLAPTAV